MLDAFDNPHSGIKPADVSKVKQQVRHSHYSYLLHINQSTSF